MYLAQLHAVPSAHGRCQRRVLCSICLCHIFVPCLVPIVRPVYLAQLHAVPSGQTHVHTHARSLPTACCSDSQVDMRCANLMRFHDSMVGRAVAFVSSAVFGIPASFRGSDHQVDMRYANLTRFHDSMVGSAIAFAVGRRAVSDRTWHMRYRTSRWQRVPICRGKVPAVKFTCGLQTGHGSSTRWSACCCCCCCCPCMLNCLVRLAKLDTEQREPNFGRASGEKVRAPQPTAATDRHTETQGSKK